jgi:hypothetical protein
MPFPCAAASLVPKLLFGHAFHETPVSRPVGDPPRNGRFAEGVPKPEFGDEVNEVKASSGTGGANQSFNSMSYVCSPFFTS